MCLDAKAQPDSSDCSLGRSRPPSATRYRAEVLARAEASAHIDACSVTSRTDIRNRLLITVIRRAGRASARPSCRRAWQGVDPGRGMIRVMGYCVCRSSGRA